MKLHQSILRTSFIFLVSAGLGLAQVATVEKPAGTAREIELLKEQLALQQKQIDQLRRALDEQRQTLANLSPRVNQEGRNEVASLRPMIPASAVQASEKPLASFQTASAQQPAAPVAAANSLAPKVDAVAKAVEGLQKSLGGFVFSGDFRYRFDLQARAGNRFAGPLQNARSRYRVRLNVDKAVSKFFDFRVQVGTGPYTNETTFDQDFAGFADRHPFSINEAWVRMKPNKNITLRVGRMEEVFADNQRFLFDDDLRLNGFEEIFRVPLHNAPKSFSSVEFRAGQYMLANPNVPILAAESPFVAAGFKAGTKVRAGNLFDTGMVVKGSFSEDWSQQLAFNGQVYRNPNLIQLASTAAGVPLVVSNAIGITLPGPVGQVGNATTTAGGPRYFADDYHILRFNYRVDSKSLFLVKKEKVPAYFDFQVSRNLGARILQDAFIATASVGAARKLGEMRFLYSYSIKDANSIVSQFTDDDLGTQSGVNTAVHAFRWDLGLTRYLQFQNLFFFQDARRGNNPAQGFFVPLPRGANTTFRYLGQLAFSF